MIPLWHTKERVADDTNFSRGRRIPVVCNWISPPGILAPSDDDIEASLSDIGEVYFPNFERDTVNSEFAGKDITQEYIKFEVELSRDTTAIEMRDVLKARTGAVDAGVLQDSELSWTPEPIKDISEAPAPTFGTGFGTGFTLATVLIAVVAGVAVYFAMKG